MLFWIYQCATVQNPSSLKLCNCWGIYYLYHHSQTNNNSLGKAPGSHASAVHSSKGETEWFWEERIEGQGLKKVQTKKLKRQKANQVKSSDGTSIFRRVKVGHINKEIVSRKYELYCAASSPYLMTDCWWNRSEGKLGEIPPSTPHTVGSLHSQRERAHCTTSCDLRIPHSLLLPNIC